MKQIIAIYGHQNCGKSEELNHVRKLIRSNEGVSLSTNLPCNGDKPETFEYKNQIIYVCPGGDTGDTVRSNYNYAYSKNADIIISASRSRGGSPGIVSEEGQKNGINIEWFQKSYEYYLSEPTQRKCNKEYAEVIFNKI